MSLDLKPGVTLPIPCRKCGKIERIILSPGKSELNCTVCDRTTAIDMHQDRSAWKVKTKLV